MNTQFNLARLILASASPRRRALLQQLGVEARVSPANVDETVRSGENPTDYAARMAREKASVVQARESGIVLAADTVVVLDGVILGKPVDREDALRTLALLSDRTHQVLSAVAVADGADLHEALSVTEVSFGHVSPARAAAYWDTGEPADKAGAYGIQGLGAVFVRRIAGSYSGVVGLPLFETAALLEQCGIAHALQPSHA